MVEVRVTLTEEETALLVLALGTHRHEGQCGMNTRLCLYLTELLHAAQRVEVADGFGVEPAAPHPLLALREELDRMNAKPTSTHRTGAGLPFTPREARK